MTFFQRISMCKTQCHILLIRERGLTMDNYVNTSIVKISGAVFNQNFKFAYYSLLKSHVLGL